MSFADSAERARAAEACTSPTMLDALSAQRTARARTLDAVPRARRSLEPDVRPSDWAKHALETVYLSVGESPEDQTAYPLRCSPSATLGQLLSRLGFDPDSAQSDGFYLVADTPVSELIPMGHLVAGRTSKLPLVLTATRDAAKRDAVAGVSFAARGTTSLVCACWRARHT